MAGHGTAKGTPVAGHAHTPAISDGGRCAVGPVLALPRHRPHVPGSAQGGDYAAGGRFRGGRRAVRRRANPSRRPALQPGDRDGPGEPEGQRQGRAGGLSWADSRPRCPGPLEGPRRSAPAAGQVANRQDPPPAGRPDDDEGPAITAFSGIAATGLAEVVPGVVGNEPVVSHDPQPAGRDDDVEPDLGGGIAGIQVSLLGERDAVDRDPALGVAAGHLVAGQPDDPPGCLPGGRSRTCWQIPGRTSPRSSCPWAPCRVPRAVPVRHHYNRRGGCRGHRRRAC